MKVCIFGYPTLSFGGEGRGTWDLGLDPTLLGGGGAQTTYRGRAGARSVHRAVHGLLNQPCNLPSRCNWPAVQFTRPLQLAIYQAVAIGNSPI